jgi:hypothetical protein
MPRHQCGRDGWHHCPICDGRIHEDGCTSKMDPRKDHCPERHKMLFDRGQIKGLSDDSFFMWSPEHPEGFHPSDLKEARK